MKLVRLIFGLIFLCFQGFAEAKNGYEIVGNIKGLPDGVTFYLIGVNDRGTADTISKSISKNQKFSIKGKLMLEAQLCFVKMDTAIYKFAKGKDTWVRLLLDNSQVQLSGNLSEWPKVLIKGSRPTEEYEKFMESLRIIAVEANRKIDSSLNDSVKIVDIRRKYNESFVNNLDIIPNSYAVPLFILKNQSLDLGDLEMLYGKLSSVLKASFYGLKLKERIESTKLSRTIVIGKEMPDFRIRTINGAEKSVKEIASKSKFTLIDFWASWCSPCRQEIPSLKKAYAMFNNKGFNIISVSIDSDPKDWQKALNEENMPWENVLEQNRISKVMFGISAIPAQILVNNKFEIVAMDYVKGNFERTQYIAVDKNKKGLRGTDLLEVMESLLKN